MDEKKRQGQEKQLTALKNQLKERKKDVDKYATGGLDGKAWIALQTDKYGGFDASGVPTTDTNGKDLSGAAKKAAQKLMVKQDSVSKQFNDQLAKDPDFYNKIKAALTDVEAQIRKLSL